VLPRLNEDVNGSGSRQDPLSRWWLTRKRLDGPMSARGKLVEASWSDAFKAIAAKFGTLPATASLR